MCCDVLQWNTVLCSYVQREEICVSIVTLLIRNAYVCISFINPYEQGKKNKVIGNVTKYHKKKKGYNTTEKDIFILERSQCIQQTSTSGSRPHLAVAHTHT